MAFDRRCGLNAKTKPIGQDTGRGMGLSDERVTERDRGKVAHDSTVT